MSHEFVSSAASVGRSTKPNSVQIGNGLPVILTHGLAASLHDWDDMLPALAATGYSAYALDLLGHGESQKPSEHAAYTAETLYSNFELWIDSLQRQEPLTLIGHSLGGALSMMYALRRPERVRALVLINPFYAIEQLPPMLQTVFLRRMLNTELLKHTPYRLFRFFVDLTSYHQQLGRREAHNVPEKVRAQTAMDYKRAATGIYNIPPTLPLRTSDMARLEQPTLLLWGDRDLTLAPHSFRNLTTLLPNLRATHVMPICGHVPHQCHPDLVNPLVLEFLAGL